MSHHSPGAGASAAVPALLTSVKPKLRVVPITELVLDVLIQIKVRSGNVSFLGESLKRYGAAHSVVVDCHNRVIAGNKTVEAAAGIKTIAVIETDSSSLVAVQREDLDRYHTQHLLYAAVIRG